MRNATIINMFVLADNLEAVTSQLVDLPVVVKRIDQQYRVQVLCDYIGFKENMIDIHYYDREERDVFYCQVPMDKVFRFTTFAKEITPEDYESEV